MSEHQIHALRRLLHLHLAQATALRLLEGRNRVEVEAFSAMTHSWTRTDLPSSQRFAKAVESAKRFFSDNWRFRPVRPADRVTLCRVVRVRELKYALNGTNRKGSTVLTTLLRDFDALGPKMSLDAAAPTVATEFSAIQDVLLNLRSEFVGARLAPYETLASAVHGVGSCWVSLPAPAIGAASSQAQFWRDRLALHHLPQSATLGDQLVRLTFVASLSLYPCPPTFDDYYVAQASMPDEIWLVRPSVGDMPNPRFVQASSHDTPALAALTGTTIDLSTVAYKEAEDELVLLRGRNARLEWVDLELLEGWPQKHPHDDDHKTFVELIKSRHAGRFE
jgi:hypothetical protein